jgi:hypothetical protein
MALKKPQTSVDLEPPFRRIGEPGWEERLRALLREYGVPEPRPVAERDLLARESSLGCRLDESQRRFLLTIGALDFESNRVLSLEEIRPIGDIWFASFLSERERRRLPRMIAAMDYLGGTDEFIAWDRDCGGYLLVRHDPAGIYHWAPTFDDCIREQCVHLAVGYYGWGDDDVEQLVEDTAQRLFPTRFRAAR